MRIRIYKRGQFWWCDFTIKGHRIRRSLKTDDKELARLIAEKIYKDELRKIMGLYRSITLSEMVRLFLEWARENKKSYRHDEIRLRKALAFFGDVPLESISVFDIEKFKASLKNEGKKPSTINRYLAVLKTLFNKAIEWGRFDGKNPVRRVRFYKEPQNKHAFSPEEVINLLKAAKEISEQAKNPIQYYFYYILLIALFTGMRLSEILSLRWEDFRETYFLIPKSKSGKSRIVPVAEFLRRELASLPRKGDYIFPVRRNPDVIRNTWKKVKRRSNVEGRFHDLRHTFATMLLQAGVDLITVKELLGHSDVAVTQLYTHTDFLRMKEAIEKLSLGTKSATRRGDMKLPIPKIEG